MAALSDEDRRADGMATTTVEAGPRTRALMRRMIRGMEMLLGEDILDPGAASETSSGELTGDISDQ